MAVSTIGRLTKRKIKHGTTSGRRYNARALSQEGAICVMDTGSTVLRVSQSKLRKEMFANDVSDLTDQSTTTTSSLPRERPDAPNDHSQEQPAPEVY